MSTSASFDGSSRLDLGNSVTDPNEEAGTSELSGLLPQPGGDTEKTAATIRDALESLSPQEREQQISKLPDQSLQQLTGTVEEGLSVGERTDLFIVLAQTLSPQQLTRVSSSLSKPANKESLSDSVSRFAPASVANAFKGGGGNAAAAPQPPGAWNQQIQINRVNGAIKATKAKAMQEGRPSPSIDGKTLWIHVSNIKGSCDVCTSGLYGAGPNGVLAQFSKLHPELRIVVTAEGQQAALGNDVVLQILNRSVIK